MKKTRMAGPTAPRRGFHRLLVLAAVVVLGGCGPPSDTSGPRAPAPPVEPLLVEPLPAPEAGPVEEAPPAELSQPAKSSQSAESIGESESPASPPPGEPLPSPSPPAPSDGDEAPFIAPPAEKTSDRPPPLGGETPPPEVKSAFSAYDEPPEPLHDPKVVMSQGHADTCLVKVGDAFPEMVLPDLDGEEKTLSDLYGARLTLVLFWSLRNTSAKEQFSRLEREVVQPYARRGVNVVAVHVGDAREEVRELRRQVGSTCPSLLDEGGQAFALIATEKLPRSYLLDAQGAILWFDIEYSLDARRELRNAIEVSLQDSK